MAPGTKRLRLEELHVKELPSFAYSFNSRHYITDPEKPFDRTVRSAGVVDYTTGRGFYWSASQLNLSHFFVTETPNVHHKRMLSSSRDVDEGRALTEGHWTSLGRGAHSFTFQRNLIRFCPCNHPTYSPKNAYLR